MSLSAPPTINVSIEVKIINVNNMLSKFSSDVQLI